MCKCKFIINTSEYLSDKGIFFIKTNKKNKKYQKIDYEIIVRSFYTIPDSKIEVVLWGKKFFVSSFDNSNEKLKKYLENTDLYCCRCNEIFISYLQLQDIFHLSKNVSIEALIEYLKELDLYEFV